MNLTYWVALAFCCLILLGLWKFEKIPEILQIVVAFYVAMMLFFLLSIASQVINF